MSILYDLRISRTLRFFLVHAVLSFAVCVLILSKHGAIHEAPVAVYFIAFVEAWLGSIAAALLSLIQLVHGLIRGFPNTNEIVLFSHAVSLPVITASMAIGAFLFLFLGRRTRRPMPKYILFGLSSVLFLTCAHFYFFDAANNANLLSHSIFVQTER